ncbi:MAG TPA: DUF1343 domain-containing protein [Tepidisphaeraceae bacterium]|jgi:uncharacterized protein YbbC (DUF1343 family)|nr:DUF1343 domain-containing protein [Tepidisphaeraceae bacterium]
MKCAFWAVLLAGWVCCSGAATSGVKTGADQVEKYVPDLKGKRVGLVGNPSSIIEGKASLDVLLGMGVKVVKAFGPEHGFRGNASNGRSVKDEVDEKTGVPIISLYGKKHRPSAADMADVDEMIYDIQDVGVRFYTNINVLREVMEACAENDKELIVLDRPNPNGYMVDGPVLDMKLQSGIGRFPIPIAYGMTVGEFAQMINGEGWLEKGRKCKLRVIPVANYTHDTPYVLPVNPSPNLNTALSVALYPSTCLFEGTILNHGRGTMMPFTVVGAPQLKGKYAFSYTPVGIPGMSEDPIYMGQVCYGLDLRGVDVEKLRQSRHLNLKWMIELYQAFPDKEHFFDQKFYKEVGSIDKLAGTTEFKKQIAAGMSEDEIRKTWEPGLAAFGKVREKYLIYP